MISKLFNIQLNEVENIFEQEWNILRITYLHLFNKLHTYNMWAFKISQASKNYPSLNIECTLLTIQDNRGTSRALSASFWRVLLFVKNKTINSLVSWQILKRTCFDILCIIFKTFLWNQFCYFKNKSEISGSLKSQILYVCKPAPKCAPIKALVRRLVHAQ